MFESIDRYFKKYQILGTLSKTTIETRKYELRRFANFCNDNGVDRPIMIDEDIIIDYLSFQKVFKKVTNFSLSTILYTITSYMDYLLKKGIIAKNWAADLEMPRYKYPEADYMVIEEVEKLFRSELDTATPKTLERNMLLLNMFFTLCLRGSEVVNLRMKDLKLEIKQIWIKRKGSYIAKFPLNDEILEQFQRWFNIRRKYKGSDSQWVFLSSRGNKLTTRQARYVVSNAMKRAGIIKRKKGTHILRHSGATYRLQNGENIKIIQKMLGHSSLATTEKYLHFDENEVKNMIERSKKMIK